MHHTRLLRVSAHTHGMVGLKIAACRSPLDAEYWTPEKPVGLAEMIFSSEPDFKVCGARRFRNDGYSTILTFSGITRLACFSQEEGWLPQHVIARDETGTVLGVVPMYLKG